MSQEPGKALELIDAKRLAAILGTTAGAVMKAKQRGHLPRSAKIPGVGVRWRLTEIEAWLVKRFAEGS